MLQKTSGIIFHTSNYSETSLIVKIYTRHFGLQSYIISGTRSKKSKNKAVLFQPLAIVDLEVSNSEKSTLQRITEINIKSQYAAIPFDITKTSIAVFINELLYKSIKEAHPDEDMFEFIINSLHILDLKQDNCANFPVYFMIQLTRYLGSYPQGSYSSATPFFDLKEGTFVKSQPVHPYFIPVTLSILLYDLLKVSYDNIQTISMIKAERKNLLNALIIFYKLHLTNMAEIKSHEILEKVMG